MPGRTEPTCERRAPLARERAVLAVVTAALCTACAGWPVSENQTDPIALRPIRGLERVEVPVPGRLEIRRNHRIGGYDALLLNPGRLEYRPGSLRLTGEAERAFLKLLFITLEDAARAAGVALESEPGRCVMEVAIDVSSLDIETMAYSESLAEMVVAMRFQDSVSGRHLLRYGKRDRVPHPATGVSEDRQLRVELARIVDEMNVGTVLRPAGLATDTRIEGCAGAIGDIGRAQEAEG